MAFTSISSTLIQVGKALKRELFTTLKDNFDDHETRINNLEGGQSQVNVFNNNVLVGSFAPTYTGIAYFKAATGFTLISAIVQIYEKGSITSGTLEIDVQTGPTQDSGTMSSIFTTLPSIDFSTAADYEESTNQVFDPSFTQITAGDWLRLDVTSLPSGLTKFYVQVYGEVQ